MRLLALNDQRSAALAQYEQCCKILAEELDAAPEEETVTLYEQIRLQVEGASIEPAFLGPPSRRPNNLPPQLTPFIGREAELTQLSALLIEPTCRLVTILGAGGIGKTRLAIQAALERIDAFTHGVYFVSLAAFQSPQEIHSGILQALQVPLEDEEDPASQLYRYLDDKNLLLILDNFEHLHAGAGIAAEILQRAPNVILLVTSRERLNLHGEWVFELQGLSFPFADQVNEIERYEAVELFIRSARRVQPDFGLQPSDSTHVVHICRLLGGMPLAIEIASSWTRLLSPAEIAHEMDADLRFLASPAQDLPPRHQSLQAVFDSSWDLLKPEEQATFRRLALFASSFERLAAEQVAGANITSLKSLVDKSLLRRNASGRYELHELTRQYAYQKLEEAGEVELVQARRLDYAIDFAEKSKTYIEGEQGSTWLRRLEEERENLNAALAWALENGKIEAGLTLAKNLYRFWYWHNHYHEGGRWLMALLDAAETITPPISAGLLADALFAAGVLAEKQKKVDLSSELLQKCLDLRISLGDLSGQASVLNSMGGNAYWQGNLEKARELFEACLHIRREIGPEEALPTPLTNLGLVAIELCDYAQAQAYFEESLAIDRKMQNDGGIGSSLSNLAWIELKTGNPARSREMYLESLALRHEFGDLEGVAYCLEGLAVALITQEASPLNATHVAHLFGLAETLREEIQSPLGESEFGDLAPSIASAQAILGEEVYRQACSEGRALNLDELIGAIS